MCPVTGSVGIRSKESTVCWLEWARQADFPGKLDLFPFSQVESRKSNGLTNWQVGMSVVLCKDIQAGTSLVETWRKPLSPPLFR